jgi:addiction module HigA family antidote
MSANALARAIRVTPNRITAIIANDAPRAVTPDTALRLGRFFGSTPQFWLNLQTSYDLSLAVAQFGKQIEDDVRPLNAG